MNAYISNDLNMVKELDPMRHELALLQADWLEKGGTIEVIPIGRSLLSAVPFNSETIPPSPVAKKNPSAVKIQKSAKGIEEEERLAEKLKAYYEKGVVAASKDLHISTRRANYIAHQYGIKFACRGSYAARQEDQALVPKIKELILQNLTQDQMCAQLNISRTTLRRISSQNGLKSRGKVNRQKDLAMVERIKAIRDIGCTRAACARQLDINSKVLLRLISEYQIDYPKQ